MINKQKLPELIEFINISKINGDEIYTWVKPGKHATSYKLDTIAVNAVVYTSDIFYQIIRNERKICFVSRKNLVFMIIADDDVQFQLLESLLEQILQQFLDFYGDMIEEYSSNYTDTFTGFDDCIDETINDIHTYIKYVKARCKVCKKIIDVCVKRSMIDNAEDYPVSLVYIHEGHGLLIYVDAGYRVRAAEIVKTSA